MNDAVAIVLASSVETFSNNDGGEETALLSAVGNFIYIFAGSFAIGSVFGCVCAFLTKFTKVSEYPILETSLVVLMSYSSFLAAESCSMTGIVAVLFCGICQAHYTYNNLSPESQKRTKQFFELLNFFLENFIFSYIGVSVITMETKHYYVPFFFASILAIFVARAANVYPMAFLLNLGRSNKIPANHQHMMMFSGLRGAIAFALAIRGATTPERNVILSTTSLIVIVTVIVCGGMTSPMLSILKIRVGVEEENLAIAMRSKPGYNTLEEGDGGASRSSGKAYKKSWFHQKFGNFDLRFLKPLLTHSKPSLEETCGGGCCRGCCRPLAKLLTSDRQRNHGIQSLDEDDVWDPRERPTATPRDELPAKKYGLTPTLTSSSSPSEDEGAVLEEGVGLGVSNIVMDEDDKKKF